jgi:hypothetical protein
LLPSIFFNSALHENVEKALLNKLRDIEMASVVDTAALQPKEFQSDILGGVPVSVCGAVRMLKYITFF